MPIYVVQVERRATLQCTLSVSAPTEEEAVTAALRVAEQGPATHWKPGSSSTSARVIHRRPPRAPPIVLDDSSVRDTTEIRPPREPLR